MQSPKTQLFQSEHGSPDGGEEVVKSENSIFSELPVYAYVMFHHSIPLYLDAFQTQKNNNLFVSNSSSQQLGPVSAGLSHGPKVRGRLTGESMPDSLCLDSLRHIITSATVNISKKTMWSAQVQGWSNSLKLLIHSSINSWERNRSIRRIIRVTMKIAYHKQFTN